MAIRGVKPSTTHNSATIFRSRKRKSDDHNSDVDSNLLVNDRKNEKSNAKNEKEVKSSLE